MTKEENKNRFLEIVKTRIHREGIEKLMSWLEKTDFFDAPASTRFHGNYPGGLLEHSLNVYDQTLKLCSLYYDEAELTDEFLESSAIASLFHDLCKAESYAKYLKNVKNQDTGRWEQVEAYKSEIKIPLGHSQKSVILLQQFMKLKLDEVYAIMGHMGFSDASFKGGDGYVSEILDKSKLALMVHMADLVSSKLLEHTV